MPRGAGALLVLAGAESSAPTGAASEASCTPPAPGSPGTSSDWPEATFWREPMSLVSRSLASVTPKRLAIEAYDSPRREW
ncbi:Uncharacterised protein [Achromobacter sp. 2789STDY5608621]|nr:Uncharacterised protein [Achromobacter sp. 2789STDY5608621]